MFNEINDEYHRQTAGRGLMRTPRCLTPDGLPVYYLHLAAELFGQLSPDLATNLNALAASLPGFTMTPDGSISAMGMSGATLSTMP